MSEYPTAESIVWCYNEIKLGKLFEVTTVGLVSYSEHIRATNKLRLEVGNTFVLCDAYQVNARISKVLQFKILMGCQIKYIQIHSDDFNVLRECIYFKEMEY